MRRDERNHPVRYRWPFTQRWYSLCSRHYVHDDSCDLCRAGQFHSDTVLAFSGFMWRRFPRFWGWWSNLPFVKWRTARFLRKHFPNLR